MSGDNTARIWDARTGEPIGQPLQHQGKVWAASFDATGARVVTTSEDKTARIWDAGTGKPIGKPLQHQGEVNTASFDATGKRVVTTGNDTTARIWEASQTGQTLMNQVRSTLGRRAPEPLKIPDQTRLQQGYMTAIARGLSTIWTRAVAALPRP